MNADEGPTIPEQQRFFAVIERELKWYPEVIHVKNFGNRIVVTVSHDGHDIPVHIRWVDYLQIAMAVGLNAEWSKKIDIGTEHPIDVIRRSIQLALHDMNVSMFGDYTQWT